MEKFVYVVNAIGSYGTLVLMKLDKERADQKSELHRKIKEGLDELKKKYPKISDWNDVGSIRFTDLEEECQKEFGETLSHLYKSLDEISGTLETYIVETTKGAYHLGQILDE